MGLGPSAKLTTSPAWGPSPFQRLGAGAASLAKANKSKSVGVAFVSALTVNSASAAEQVCPMGLVRLQATHTQHEDTPSTDR